MKSVSRFLLIALAFIPAGVYASPVATTAGSNLTAYNPGFGAANNNTWNMLSNVRSGAESAPVADFGNCNALIMRCAQPKCASGGCTDLSVASGIVSGCVNANSSCKKYGDDLVNYIASQLVATSTARANQAAAAASATAAQNDAAMQAMQQQMSQTQQMLAQQTQAMNELKTELAQQQQATAQAIADATASAAAAQSVVSSGAGNSDAGDVVGGNNLSNNSDNLSSSQRAAAAAAIDPNSLVREQISGKILTQIENAEQSLDALKVTMQDVFTYAGCDSRGSNCTGPKRVTTFKDKAMQFFDPYENVLDSMYEALYLAQSVGVDISNIYQYLNSSCNQWGKYACAKPLYAAADPTMSGRKIYAWPRYDHDTCPGNKSKPNGIISHGNEIVGSTKGGHDCSEGQIIPPEDDTSCTLIGLISGVSDEDSKVAYNFLYPEEGDMGNMVRVGCASSMLDSSWLFRGRKQKASVDIETLRRIIEQDAHSVSTGVTRSRTGLGQQEQLKYCAITEGQYANLQRYVTLKGLPTKDICINERRLNSSMGGYYIANSDNLLTMAKTNCENLQTAAWSDNLKRCYCVDKGGRSVASGCDQGASESIKNDAERQVCERYRGQWINNDCYCKDITYDEDRRECEYQFPSNNTPTNTTTSNARKNAKQLKTECTQSAVPGLNTCNEKIGWDTFNNVCVCDGQQFDPKSSLCVKTNTDACSVKPK